MTLLESYRKLGTKTMSVFRLDLQVHFFWGFILTLLGVYWWPLFASGVVVTLVKEALDLWSKKHWSWGDTWSGLLGCLCAAGFIVTGDQFFCKSARPSALLD
ncbi:hypothetical protein [Megalodesulfovibrio gigas]|uniref:Uncharacterized protein n=1 Tax=Megalodesulfovibrio gigas (strain ATCC 19364 / DSM 1382 / NCIMB 9332 / VKM B-1759) TaxID=1121448 RepID=T2GAJ2_MEGG1|nr:hypothetical protein [Megalodesulfovibrio gigas]AGW13590.1 hypothetical protein DGI_1791 [Megalodesulfovibrio gigas DSM 1382 = ATCC 19364]